MALSVCGARSQSQPFVPGSDKEDRADQFKETLKRTGPVGGPDQVQTLLQQMPIGSHCEQVVFNDKKSRADTRCYHGGY